MARSAFFPFLPPLRTLHTPRRRPPPPKPIPAPSIPYHLPHQRFPHFLVVDFEATCDSTPRFAPQEIIEFPVLKVDASDLRVNGVFHTFVRPTVNPTLTPFCSQLTGVSQSDLEDRPTLPETLVAFEEWLRRERLVTPTEEGLRPDFAFVAYGDWDLGRMLPNECRRLGVTPPPGADRWIDVKRSFGEAFGRWPSGMAGTLDALGLPLVGRLHSGIDDSRNILRIMSELVKRKGFVFNITSWLKDGRIGRARTDELLRHAQ